MSAPKWFPRPEGSLTGLFMPYLRSVRVEFNGETVAESPDVMLLRDGKSQGYLHYLFADDEVQADFLVETGRSEQTEKGEIHYRDVVVGDERAADAAFSYPNEPIEGRPDLRGYTGFEWTAMDAWYEEDERVIGHPRDPYNRVDTVRSSRHVRVEVDGVTVAETDRPTLVFETGHPRRYYFPPADVDTDRLTPTDATWHCPYKGPATFWTIEVGDNEYENLAWAYPEPFKDATEIEGMIGFYNEKLDIFVDGEREGKPTTRFSMAGDLDIEEIKKISEHDVMQ